MYVARPLSMYKKYPSALQSPPPEGPNSGVLVILDEEAEPTCCFGKCKSCELPQLPFPQNKNLKTRYTIHTGEGSYDSYNKVVFIPVLNQPLSSNRYYAIKPCGRHKGKAFASSKEDDKATCCFCSFVSDVKPQPFDPNNHYQQFEIFPRGRSCGFFAKSVAPDGFPPCFLRRKGWKLVTKTARNLELDEAPGLDMELRARLPDFNFPLSNKSSKPVTVGKWYIPFIFIKEGTLEDQMNRSMYYETTLEQRWEQIFSCDNNGQKVDKDAVVVVVDVAVEREVVSLFGGEKENLVPADHHIEWRVVDGVMWFKSSSTNSRDHVGLSSEIVERMDWEEERFGWVRGNERQVSVKREEQFCGGVHGSDQWRKFGCYVLAERFVLKRMDGSLLLTYDFMHTHHIRSKWE
ncbi:hypothetical protein JRO89_XS02G0029600 [Xanthoceras sorbifolium]|uniref:Uncharacterized protein n=1 Tax=Xanthoceras sorbifolium TaxID=99658 RepID=A0ABQ8IE93_9ROSI|nr:hypothetical protein JRO89_XS02G0029600 [Xanthoceras sorbifolium]